MTDPSDRADRPEGGDEPRAGGDAAGGRSRGGRSAALDTTPMDSAQRGRGPFVWRFSLYHRVIHALAMTSFYILVLTGIPLRFACAPFARPLMELWGGPEQAGLIHRGAAIVMVAYTVAHVGWLVVKFLQSEDKKKWLWGPDSLVPHPDDARDFVKQWKWYFGKGERPQFGRYGYLEKMDYLGEVWGFIIIGGSGVVLWFPEFFGQYLPGWFFNVATVFHGYEALIAAGFIFMVHFFNVHLRPDKFPLDAVMFTGRATLDYMEEEHPGVMPQIEARLDEPPSRVTKLDAPAPPPGRTESIVAAVLGFIALGVGLALIGMIVWAVFC